MTFYKERPEQTRLLYSERAVRDLEFIRGILQHCSDLDLFVAETVRQAHKALQGTPWPDDAPKDLNAIGYVSRSGVLEDIQVMIIHFEVLTPSTFFIRRVQLADTGDSALRLAA